MGSERLPGKMLMDLGGKPLLAHVIDRLKQCKSIERIVVATPDDEIAKAAFNFGAFGFVDTGDPANVLGRYIKAGGWSGAQLVVRITGDCPFVDPNLVDRCVKESVEGRYDLVSTVVRRTYPKGMDIEVMHLNVLKRIYHLTEEPRHREHVTLFAYENPALFVAKGVSQNRDFSRLNLSVDTKYDIDFLSYFITHSTYDGTWAQEAITDWFTEWEARRPFEGGVGGTEHLLSAAVPGGTS